MSKLLILVSATIVVFFQAPSAMAAPDTHAPPDEEQVTPWTSEPPDENLQISEPPELKGKPGPVRARYYPYQQALTFRGGLASDFPKLGFKDQVLGFQYLFPKFLSPKLEAGADLHPDGEGHLHAGVRWIAWERDYFRPSAKLGLDHHAEGDEGLATLARLENYYFRVSGTLEYVVWNPYSLRFEAEMLINFDNTWTVVTLGISRGW